MAQFDTQNIKRIGVYSSGGDAPGMNAALRASVRTALHKGLEVYGIYQGYQGLLNKQWKKLSPGDMANIIQRGGTILKSGRCPEFTRSDQRQLAAKNLKSENIDALICIGGDGSFTGASLLWQEHRIPIIGVPGTIDNDIYGTDKTIGFETAVNTALEAIDKIRDTAASHDRLFIVEVMGRNSGFIAMDVAIAGGAEAVFVPETTIDLNQTIHHIKQGMARGKTSSILITAEGQKPGRAYDLAESIRKKSGFEAKVCILGHVQRGGSPLAADRILASHMGMMAIETLMQGHCNVMIAKQGQDYVFLDMEIGISKKKKINPKLVELLKVLSR